MMFFFRVSESLALLLPFAVLSGLCMTLAATSTHLPKRLEKMMKDRSDSDEESSSPTQSPENILFSQEKVKKIWWIIAYFFNFLFAFLAGLLGIIGPWFGPVSIFSPVKQIAQILCSVVTFSYVLKTEEFPSKETSLGHYILLFSGAMLVVVGPELRKDTEAYDTILSHDGKLNFIRVIVFIAVFVTVPFQFYLLFRKTKESNRAIFLMLLLTEAIHMGIETSSSKFLPILDGSFFGYNLVLIFISKVSIAFTSIMRISIITHQTEYLLFLLSMNILLNAIVGLVVWDDKIINRGGYVCTFLFFVMGVYLISDYQVQQQQAEVSILNERIRRLLLPQKVSSNREADAEAVIHKEEGGKDYENGLDRNLEPLTNRSEYSA